MSGVADRLGTGASFGNARGRSARGRAKAVTQGDVPAYELVRLQLNDVCPTPLNPRRNFGTDEDLTRFGEELRQVQLAACVAVTAGAYLALWPEHKERVGSVQHVLCNGERRYRSAVHVGLEALDFVVRDDLASSRETFINHLLKENLEREDFDVIERARGVQQLVDVCAEQAERGARTRAAEQLRKDRSWVTNQLVLLELPEELQAMLSAGSLAERDGRTLARYAKDNPQLDTAALLDHLKALKEAEAQAKAAERGQLRALRTPGDSGLLSADNKPGLENPAAAATPPIEETGADAKDGLLSADNKLGAHPADAPDTGNLLSADNKPSSLSPAPAKPPAQRQRGSEDDQATALPQSEAAQPRQLPYDDAPFLALHLQRKMEPAVFAQFASVVMGALRDQDPAAYGALLAELTQHEQQST